MQEYQRQHQKQCPKCLLWLPYSNFNVDRGRRDGLYYCCRSCEAKRRKERRSPIRQRNSWLRHKYGLTLAQYERLLIAQDGVCAICKNPESQIDYRTGAIRSFAVDHDHRTGDVRALLCYTCNTSLGLMNEDPERIQALLDYAKWCQTRESSLKIIQLSIVEMEM